MLSMVRLFILLTIAQLSIQNDDVHLFPSKLISSRDPINSPLFGLKVNFRKSEPKKLSIEDQSKGSENLSKGRAKFYYESEEDEEVTVMPFPREDNESSGRQSVVDLRNKGRNVAGNSDITQNGGFFFTNGEEINDEQEPEISTQERRQEDTIASEEPVYIIYGRGSNTKVDGDQTSSYSSRNSQKDELEEKRSNFYLENYEGIFNFESKKIDSVGEKEYIRGGGTATRQYDSIKKDYDQASSNLGNKNRPSNRDENYGADEHQNWHKRVSTSGEYGTDDSPQREYDSKRRVKNEDHKNPKLFDDSVKIHGTSLDHFEDVDLKFPNLKSQKIDSVGEKEYIRGGGTATRQYDSIKKDHDQASTNLGNKNRPSNKDGNYDAGEHQIWHKRVSTSGEYETNGSPQREYDSKRRVQNEDEPQILTQERRQEDIIASEEPVYISYGRGSNTEVDGDQTSSYSSRNSQKDELEEKRSNFYLENDESIFHFESKKIDSVGEKEYIRGGGTATRQYDSRKKDYDQASSNLGNKNRPSNRDENYGADEHQFWNKRVRTSGEYGIDDSPQREYDSKRRVKNKEDHKNFKYFDDSVKIHGTRLDQFEDVEPKFPNGEINRGYMKKTYEDPKMFKEVDYNIGLHRSELKRNRNLNLQSTKMEQKDPRTFDEVTYNSEKSAYAQHDNYQATYDVDNSGTDQQKVITNYQSLQKGSSSNKVRPQMYINQNGINSDITPGGDDYSLNREDRTSKTSHDSLKTGSYQQESYGTGEKYNGNEHRHDNYQVTYDVDNVRTHQQKVTTESLNKFGKMDYSKRKAQVKESYGDKVRSRVYSNQRGSNRDIMPGGDDYSLNRQDDDDGMRTDLDHQETYRKDRQDNSNEHQYGNFKDTDEDDSRVAHHHQNNEQSKKSTGNEARQQIYKYQHGSIGDDYSLNRQDESSNNFQDGLKVRQDNVNQYQRGNFQAKYEDNSHVTHHRQNNEKFKKASDNKSRPQIYNNQHGSNSDITHGGDDYSLNRQDESSKNFQHQHANYQATFEDNSPVTHHHQNNAQLKKSFDNKARPQIYNNQHGSNSDIKPGEDGYSLNRQDESSKNFQGSFKTGPHHHEIYGKDKQDNANGHQHGNYQATYEDDSHVTHHHQNNEQFKKSSGNKARSRIYKNQHGSERQETGSYHQETYGKTGQDNSNEHQHENYQATFEDDSPVTHHHQNNEQFQKSVYSNQHGSTSDITPGGDDYSLNRQNEPSNNFKDSMKVGPHHQETYRTGRQNNSNEHQNSNYQATYEDDSHVNNHHQSNDQFKKSSGNEAKPQIYNNQHGSIGYDYGLNRQDGSSKSSIEGLNIGSHHQETYGKRKQDNLNQPHSELLYDTHQAHNRASYSQMGNYQTTYEALNKDGNGKQAEMYGTHQVHNNDGKYGSNQHFVLGNNYRGYQARLKGRNNQHVPQNGANEEPISKEVNYSSIRQHQSKEDSSQQSHRIKSRYQVAKTSYELDYDTAKKSDSKPIRNLRHGASFGSQYKQQNQQTSKRRSDVMINDYNSKSIGVGYKPRVINKKPSEEENHLQYGIQPVAYNRRKEEPKTNGKVIYIEPEYKNEQKQHVHSVLQKNPKQFEEVNYGHGRYDEISNIHERPKSRNNLIPNRQYGVPEIHHQVPRAFGENNSKSNIPSQVEEYKNFEKQDQDRYEKTGIHSSIRHKLRQPYPKSTQDLNEMRHLNIQNNSMKYEGARSNQNGESIKHKSSKGLWKYSSKSDPLNVGPREKHGNYGNNLQGNFEIARNRINLYAGLPHFSRSYVKSSQMNRPHKNRSSQQKRFSVGKSLNLGTNKNIPANKIDRNINGYSGYRLHQTHKGGGRSMIYFKMY